MSHDWLLSPHECPGFKKFEKVSSVSSGGQRSYTEYIHVKIPERYALVNVTERVEEGLERSGVVNGLCYVGAMHIAAGIYVNDAES